MSEESKDGGDWVCEELLFGDPWLLCIGVMSNPEDRKGKNGRFCCWSFWSSLAAAIMTGLSGGGGARWFFAFLLGTLLLRLAPIEPELLLDGVSCGFTNVIERSGFDPR